MKNFLTSVGATLLIAGSGVGTTLVGTGIIGTPLTENQQRAEAFPLSVSVNIDINTIFNAAISFWRNYYAVKYLQVYYASYSPQQVAAIKKQYGSSANSVFNAGCKSVYYSWQKAVGWQTAIVDPFGWFFFVQREENGYVNCYVRAPQK